MRSLLLVLLMCLPAFGVDMWFDVDAAITEAPVNILPLTDDTDFKTRETSVAYDASGMDLVWNFVTTAGATTQTAVTPTTSGDYDWAHQGDGMYTIEIPATGGASINNDTEGFGWFTGYATGVLPWRGPIIGFRDSNLNNALIDGAASVDAVPANTSHWNGTAVATPDTAGYPVVTIKDGTGSGELDLTSGSVDVYSIRGSTPDSAADVADAVWDEASSGHTDAGKAGQQLWTDIDAILADTGTDGVTVLELKASALADMFNTDSGTTYSSAVAGSVVKETADNAGGSALTESGIADAVWDEVQSGHTTSGTFGKYLDTEVSGVGGGSLTEAGIADAVWDESSNDHKTSGTTGWLLRQLRNLWR